CFRQVTIDVWRGERLYCRRSCSELNPLYPHWHGESKNRFDIRSDARFFLRVLREKGDVCSFFRRGGSLRDS
ncbi:MAG: hypothetical protein ACYCRD_11215, partial [Leptospirillum sp.]